MIKTRIIRIGAVSAFILLFLLALPPLTAVPAAEETFEIDLWTNGVVRYKFDDLGPEAVTDEHRVKVRDEMNRWETALEIADPVGGPARKYITFEECIDCPEACPADVVVIRYNTPEEDYNFCTVGMRPGTCTVLHMEEDLFRSPNGIRHELGHCLGLWHEFNRGDADRWLVEDPDLDWNCDQPDVDGECFPEAFNTRAALMPMLGNYDYDSLMHYSFDNVTDRLGNHFGRHNLDNDPAVYVSERDRSRLLQYYARQRHPDWGFFESLSFPAWWSETELPNPYLAPDVRAVGTPGIASQSPGNFDIFVRGSDNRLYWGPIRDGHDLPRGWFSLGCCFGSDPSAVSPRDGEIDLVAIGAFTGKLIHKHFEDEAWGPARYVQGGYPTGGIKQAANGGYIGPAIASREADSLDVFVVRSDGLLAVTTLSNGEWTAWGTLAHGYNVTARPAAVALSETTVKLAFNERGMYLYEGGLSFAPAVPSFGFYRTAVMAYQTPPVLTKRDDPNNPYRVLITNADGRISHRFASGSWIDTGGIPKPGTGPSAVATGRFSAYIVINGEDATGCTVGCAPGAPNPNQVIQPGGLWLRRFE